MSKAKQAPVPVVMDRIWKKLCPHCSNRHILDNGRVWVCCGLWKIIRKPGERVGCGLTERFVYRMIEARFGEAE